MPLLYKGMRFKKYTEDQLRQAVSESFSLASTLKKLGIVPAGGNYQTLKKAIEHLSLDTSHFTGQGYLKGKTHRHNTRSLKEVLVYGRFENTYRLKNRLLRDEVKEERCENCHLTEWLGETMPLELHHIDGDHKNNVLDNLTLLCPNCHTLTDNYRGKNKTKV